MTDDVLAVFRRLSAQWRDLITRYRAACREANHDGNIELDAYRDGKAMGMGDCLYDLDAAVAGLLASPQETTVNLDSRDFYEVMQTYRHAPIDKPAQVVEAFEAVKAWLRSAALAPQEEPQEKHTTGLELLAHIQSWHHVINENRRFECSCGAIFRLVAPADAPAPQPEKSDE